MSNFDFGSKRPLNWADPQFAEPIEKAQTHQARAEEHFRMGTPITRRGAFHGYPSAFQPNRFAPEVNPELVLKAGGGEGSRGGNVIGHTRSGKPVYGPNDSFVSAARSAQSGGTDATDKLKQEIKAHQQQHADFTKEDHEDAAKMHNKRAATERSNAYAGGNKPVAQEYAKQSYASKELAAGRAAAHSMAEGAHSKLSKDPNYFANKSIDILKSFTKALGTMDVPLQQQQHQQPPMGQGAPQIPGVGMRGASQPQQIPHQGNPIGLAPSGIPIYADPFHPAHKDFDKQDHEAAAAQHEKLAGAAGSPQEASQHLQASAAHKQMGSDSQSPMERFAQKFQPPQGPPMSTPQGGRTMMPGPGATQPNTQGAGAGMPMAQMPKPPGMGGATPPTPGQGPGMPGMGPPPGSQGMGSPSPPPGGPQFGGAPPGGGMGGQPPGPALAKPAPPPMPPGMGQSAMPGMGAMGAGQPPPGQVRPPQMPGGMGGGGMGGQPPAPPPSPPPGGQSMMSPGGMQPPAPPRPPTPPPMGGAPGMGGGQGMGGMQPPGGGGMTPPSRPPGMGGGVPPMGGGPPPNSGGPPGGGMTPPGGGGPMGGPQPGAPNMMRPAMPQAGGQPGAGAPSGQAPGLPSMQMPKPQMPPPAAQPPSSNPGQPPMGTPQGQPPMGTQGMGPGGPAGPPGGSPSGSTPRDPFASLQGLLNPDQGKPQVGNPMPTTQRQGPIPGMYQVQPSAGSSTVQAPMGMPRPTRMVGPAAPPTNAGSQQTPIEPTAYKALQSWLSTYL